MSIFVGNLPFRAEREDVLQLFAPYGEVTNCSLPLERDTGRKRGFAFIEMADEALETSAIEALQGAEMMGRPLRINKAEPRNNTPRRNFNNNNPRNSSGPGYNQNNSGSYSSNNQAGGYNSGYSGGYSDQNQTYENRSSGSKGWEDRSYGNNTENSEFESSRSRRRRGASNDIDNQGEN